MSPIFYLPTVRLYQKPNYENHDRAVKSFVSGVLGEQYTSGKGTESDKWDLLMNAFVTTVPEEYKALLSAFQEKRKGVEEGNRYNLSLEDARSFFEHFYFLYNARNPEFCPSERNRNKLLEDLKRAISPDVCEPGITTEFNAVLRKYRKDSNWIVVELHEYRCNIIQRIADEYNAFNGVTDAFSIHTVMYMFQLAKDKLIGVSSEKEIEDIFTASSGSEEKKAYFNSVYQGYFAEYEQNLETNLTLHLLQQFKTQVLSSNDNLTVDIASWEANPLLIPEQTIQLINERCNEFLEVHFSEEVLVDFITQNDKDEFVLASKKDIEVKLRRLVKEKLIQDQYLVHYDDLTPDNVESFELRLPDGMTGKELCQLQEKLTDAKNNPEQLLALIKNNKSFVQKYPYFIAKSLLDTPQTWYFLPANVKNDLDFIDGLLSYIDSSLSQLEDSEGALISAKPLIDFLLHVVKDNPDVLKTHPFHFLSNKTIALTLLKRNGLLYKYLPDNLQHDAEICACAVGQNAAVIDYLPDNRSTSLAEKRIILEDLGLTFSRMGTEVLLSLDKTQNAITLLTTEVVPITKLIQLAQPLTPLELLDIIKLRNEKGLAEFPGFDELALKGFISALSLDDKQWDTTFLDFKRRNMQKFQTVEKGILLSTDQRESLAMQCIAESNKWVAAFLTYQNNMPNYLLPFNNSDAVYQQLLMTYKLLHSLLRSIKAMCIVLAKTALAYLLWLLTQMIGLALTAIAAIGTPLLLANLGVFTALFLQLFIARLLLQCVWPDLTSLIWFCLGVLALISTTGFIALVIEMEVAFAVYVLGAAIGMLTSNLFGLNWTFSEINSRARAILFYGIFADVHLLFSFITTCWTLVQSVLLVWPNHVFSMIVPWVTRTLVTFNSLESRLDGDALLKVKVEGSIQRLLGHDAASAKQKGQVLESLWDRIEKDVEQSKGRLSLKGALNRKYSVSVDGVDYHQKSFMEIAAIPRGDAMFSLNNTKSYSFFGYNPKTTTEKILQAYATKESQVAEYVEETPVVAYAC